MLTYDEIRETQRKEKSNSALSQISSDFYEQANKLVVETQNLASAESNISTVRKYNNLKRILGVILRKREEKIVFIAIHGVKPENLLEKEQRFYDDIVRSLSKFRNSVEQKDKVFKRLRIVKKVERYKGIDDNVYGPFDEGEEIKITKAEAEWLVKAEMAEMII